MELKAGVQSILGINSQTPRLESEAPIGENSGAGGPCDNISNIRENE